MGWYIHDWLLVVDIDTYTYLRFAVLGVPLKGGLNS